jgi:hypothetical protein
MLIRRMAKENPVWAQERIAYELLLKLLARNGEGGCVNLSREPIIAGHTGEICGNFPHDRAIDRSMQGR